MTGIQPKETTRIRPGFFPWVGVPVCIVLFSAVARFVPAADCVLAEDLWLRDWVWPAMSAISRALKAGQFPLWCPDQQGGFSLIADPRMPVMAPFTWIFAWLPFDQAVLAHGMGCLTLAGCFMVLWTRAMGVSALSSLLAAAVYLLGPFSAAASGRPALETVFCWLPLACWAAGALFSRSGAAPLVIGAISLGLLMLSGDPAAAAIGVIAALVQGWVCGWAGDTFFSRVGKPKRDGHAILGLLLMVGGALMIMVPQWGPALRQMFWNAGKADLIWSGLPACCVLPGRAGQVVEHLLTPRDGIRWGDAAFSLHLIYIHPVSLLLALAALSGLRQKPHVAAPAVMAAFLPLGVAGNFLYPGSIRWEMFALAGQAGLAVLCAFGADTLFGPEPLWTRRRLLIIFLFVSGGIFVITGGVARGFLLFFAVCCIGMFIWGHPYPGGVFRFLLLVVTAVTLYREMIIPMNLPGRLQGISRAAVSEIAGRLQVSKVQGRAAVFPLLSDEVPGSRNLGMVAGVPFFGGWNLLEAPDNLTLPQKGQQIVSDSISAEAVHSMLRVYAVNALLSSSEKETDALHDMGFSRAGLDREVSLWVRQQPVPQISLYHQWAAAPDSESVLSIVKTVDLEKVCVLRLGAEDTRILADRLALEGKPEAENQLDDSVSVMSDSEQRLTLQVQSNQSALLMVADAWDPDWICRVNGRRTPIYQANGFARAVVVPAGSSEVEFLYQPFSWKLGLALALLMLGTCAISGLAVLMSRLSGGPS